MKVLSLLLLLVATSAFAASPSTVNNDDSCDVTVSPAADVVANCTRGTNINPPP
jgi:hypothetical protein